MKGVLIAGHGSRQKSTERTLETVVEMMRESLTGVLLEIAYMEFGKKDIPEGLAGLAARGADEIIVAPYFLFDGIHIRKDIPEIVEKFKSENPKISVVIGKPLGVDRRLSELLLDRIKEML